MPHMLNSDLINMLMLNGQTSNPAGYSTHHSSSVHHSIADGLIQQQQFTAYQQSLVVARLNELMARPNMQVNAIAALLASILNTSTPASQSNATNPSNAGSNTTNCNVNNMNGTNNKMNLSRYKTELCRQFTETGECKYGDKCQFAHGEPDLKKVPRHPKYKTDLCKTFHSKGFCPYGPRCHFLHELDDEMRSVQPTGLLTNSPISNSMSSLLNMSSASTTPSTRSPSSSSQMSDVFSPSTMLDSMPQTPVRSRSTASNYPSTSSSSTCDFFHTTPESSSLLDSSSSCLSIDHSTSAHIQQFNLFNTSATAQLPHMAFTQGFKW